MSAVRDSHGALTARAARASVATAAFLLLIKAFAAWHTGSVAMLGSLTVLPALLSRLGDGVDRGRFRKRKPKTIFQLLFN